MTRERVVKRVVRRKSLYVGVGAAGAVGVEGGGEGKVSTM